MRATAARARRWLTAPVDVASLAAVRVLFGTLLAAATVRYVAKGWLHGQLIAPAFHFPYGPLRFVQPWPGVGMYVHAGVVVVAAVWSRSVRG